MKDLNSVPYKIEKSFSEIRKGSDEFIENTRFKDKFGALRAILKYEKQNQGKDIQLEYN